MLDIAKVIVQTNILVLGLYLFLFLLGGFIYFPFFRMTGIARRRHTKKFCKILYVGTVLYLNVYGFFERYVKSPDNIRDIIFSWESITLFLVYLVIPLLGVIMVFGAAEGHSSAMRDSDGNYSRLRDD